MKKLIACLCGLMFYGLQPLNADYICNGFTPQFTVSDTNPDVGENITLSYTGNICFNGTVCNANQFVYSISGSVAITGLAVQTNTGQVQDVQVSWNNPGVYTITLEVTANPGCGVNTSQLQTITITVGSAGIPTVGEWGIIVLFIGMTIISVISLKARRPGVRLG